MAPKFINGPRKNMKARDWDDDDSDDDVAYDNEGDWEVFNDDDWNDDEDWDFEEYFKDSY